MSTAGPAHRVQSAVVEYGYPHGHLGHLSPDEEAAFKNLKLLCEEKGYYKPGDGGDTPATHEDATLLWVLSPVCENKQTLANSSTDDSSEPVASLYKMRLNNFRIPRIGVRQSSWINYMRQ